MEESECFACRPFDPERPPIESLGCCRLWGEIDIVFIAREGVVHRAGDRAEASGVFDERVG